MGCHASDVINVSGEPHSQLCGHAQLVLCLSGHCVDLTAHLAAVLAAGMFHVAELQSWL